LVTLLAKGFAFWRRWLLNSTTVKMNTMTMLGKDDLPYRGTSLIRKRTPLGPYRRPMPRVLGGCQGGGDQVGVLLWARYPCTCRECTNVRVTLR